MKAIAKSKNVSRETFVKCPHCGTSEVKYFGKKDFGVFREMTEHDIFQCQNKECKGDHFGHKLFPVAKGAGSGK